MRYALAIVVVAITSAAAVYIHQRRVPYGTTHLATLTTNDAPQATLPNIFGGAVTYHPIWEDPVAVLLGLGGVALAVGIAAPRRRTAAT